MSPNASVGQAWNEAEAEAGHEGVCSPDVLAAELREERVSDVTADCSPLAYTAHTLGLNPDQAAAIILAPFFQIAAAGVRQGVEELGFKALLESKPADSFLKHLWRLRQGRPCSQAFLDAFRPLVRPAMLVGGLLSELDPQKQQRPAHWLRLQTSPEADWRGRLASALAWQLFQEALRCCDGRNLSEAQRSTAGLLAGKLALAMGCSLHSGSVQGSRQQHQAPTAAPAVLELPPALLWDLLHEAIDHALELGASFMQRKADELAVLHGLLEAGAQVFRERFPLYSLAFFKSPEESDEGMHTAFSQDTLPARRALITLDRDPLLAAAASHSAAHALRMVTPGLAVGGFMRYLDLRAVRRALVEDGFKGRSYLCSSEGLSKLNATLGCDTSPGASNVGLVRLLSSGGNLSRPVQQVLDTLRATVAPRSGALSPEAEALLCSASYLLQQAPVGVLSSGEARYAEGTSAAARQAARPWRYRDPASGSSELCFFGVQLRSSAVPSAEQLQNVRTLLFA